MPINGLDPGIRLKGRRHTMVMRDTEAGIQIGEGYISYWDRLMDYTLMEKGYWGIAILPDQKHAG
jgi:hypothetical protein